MEEILSTVGSGASGALLVVIIYVRFMGQKLDNLQRTLEKIEEKLNAETRLTARREERVRALERAVFRRIG